MNCPKCKKAAMWQSGLDYLCPNCGHSLSLTEADLHTRLSNVEEMVKGIVDMVLSRNEREEIRKNKPI